VFTHYRR